MKQIAKIFVILFAALVSTGLAAQNKVSVSGKVVDEKGVAVPGAVVMAEGSITAAMTDSEGRYSIEFYLSAGRKAQLTVSCMGFLTQTVDVGKRAVIDFTLAEDTQLLDEAVVVGYGSMRRSDLTGSVTSVKVTEDAANQNATFDKLLQGRAAGVQVVSNSSAPDAGVSVLIRGASSFNSSTEPLYVVDGVIISADSNVSLLTQGNDNANSNEASNGLMGINPQDIASIEILKDASATAIYGSQGANGVVLITTKTANRDKPVINASAGVSVSQRYKKIRMLDFDEFVDYLEHRGANSNTYLRQIYDDPANHKGLKVRPMDWQDYTERTAISQNYYVSIAGRPKNTSYMASFAYSNSEGIIKTTGYDNYVLRLNLDKQVTKRLKLSTKTNFSYLDSHMTQGANAGRLTAATSLMRSMFSSKPYRNLREEVDDLDDINDGGTDFISGPDRWIKDFQNRREEIRFTPSFSLEYKILPWLSFRSTTGGDFRTSDQYKWKSSRINSTAEGSTGAVGHTRWLYWNTNNMFNAFKKFGDHRLNATVGITASSSGGSTETVEGWNVEQYKAQINALNSAPNTAFRYTETESHLTSGLARLIYNYKERYVLTSTYRLDGSSKFRGSNKWASFPSFAFAWRPNNEAWFKIPKVSMLKLRLGWGRVGNQAISSYQTMSTYVSSETWPSHAPGNDAHYSVALYPDNVSNPHLKWETTEQTNIGLDLGLWRGRFTLTVDAYDKYTRDLLQSKTIPGSSGYTSMWMNMGAIDNKGIEITLDTTPIKAGGFEWQLGGNISFNRNRIVKIGKGSEGDYIFLSPTEYKYKNFFYGQDLGWGSYCKAPLNIFIEGQPMSLFYGYKTAGVVQMGEQGIPISEGGAYRDPGAIQYVDLDGNGYVDNYDRTIIGDPNPDFTYGFNTTFVYRHLSLNLSFTGSWGNDIYNVNQVMNTDVANVGYNLTYEAYKKAWTQENMSQKYPAIDKYEAFDMQIISDRFVEDGSYLRLSSVTLAYDLPLKKAKFVRGMNFSLSGNNLWIWTRYSGFDPDVNSYGSVWRKGADMGSYPGARSVMFTAKFTF